MTTVRKENEPSLVQARQQEEEEEKTPYRLDMGAITVGLKKQLPLLLQARNFLTMVIKIILLALMLIILLRDILYQNHPQSTSSVVGEVNANQALIDRILQYLLHIPITHYPHREWARETNNSYGSKAESFETRILA